ncbi:serine hydrolase [Pseudochelatococcus sp. B33]
MKRSSRLGPMMRTIAGLSLGAAMCALAAGHARAREWSELTSVLQGVLDAVASQDNATGVSIAVDRNGGADTWIGSRGYADLAQTRPITPDTQFRIGSASKTITGSVLLSLADKGMVNLDAPINDYVADLNIPNGDVITVRNALSMTSGLPEYLVSPSLHHPHINILQEWANFHAPNGPHGMAGYTPEQLIEAVVNGINSGAQPPGAVGEMSYSNTNFVLLGIIAQRLTGQDLETLAHEIIFGPAGMTDSALPTDNQFTSADYAESYQNLVTMAPYTVPAGSVFNMTFLDPQVPWAAGAMLSSPADELRWIRELATNDRGILSEEMQAQRLDFQYPGSIGSVPASYGLAISEMPSMGSGSQLIGHSGLIAGYTTSLFYNPDIDFSYAINLLGYQTQAAYWFPYFGAQEWYAAYGYQTGDYTPVPILWALDRNVSLAVSAQGTCSFGGTFSANADGGVTCAGDNVRTSPLTVRGKALTIEPSNRTIDAFYVDVDTYYSEGATASLSEITLPRPSLATFGSNIAAIALEGDASLDIAQGATVELWGENSSAVSMTGSGNRATISGAVNTYGNRSYALLAQGQGNGAVVAATGSVLGSMRLEGQGNTLAVHGAVAGGVELAGRDGDATVTGNVAAPAVVMIPSAVQTYQLGANPLVVNTATDQAAVVEGASNRFRIDTTGTVDGRVSIRGQGNALDIAGGLTSADAYLRDYIAGQLASGVPTPSFSIPAATAVAIDMSGNGNRATVEASGKVLGTAHVEGSGNVFQMNGRMAGLLSLAGTGNGASVGGSLVADVSRSSFALLGSGTGNTLTVEGSGQVLGNASVVGANRIHVDGLVVGAVEVADGARLTGNGVVDGTVGGQGGTVSPGSSVGSLTVGNYVARGNTLQIESDPFGRSDHLLVSHVADLDHGSLLVQPPAGATSRVDTVLTAGTVQGRFGSVSFLSPGHRAGVGTRYSPTAVQVATVSPFQQDAATQLGADDTLRSLDILERRAARLRGAGARALTPTAVPAADAGRSGAGAGDDVTQWLSSIRAPAPSADTDGALWVQAYGGHSRIYANDGVPSIRSTVGGVMAGVDGEIADSLLLGIAGGYSHGTSDTGAAFSPSYRSDAFSVGLYGSYGLGRTLLSGSFFIGRGDDKLTQTYWMDHGGGAIATASTAKFNDLRTAGRLAASTVFDLGPFNLTPRAAITLLNVSVDDYTEQSAFPGMYARWRVSDYTLLRPELTVILQKQHEFSSGGVLRRLSGEVEVGIARDAVLDKARATVLMPEFSPITVQGFDADAWALIVGARLGIEATDQVNLFASYDGSFSSKKSSQSVRGGLEVRF